MAKREGFTGERIHVVPRPLVAEALQRPGTDRLLVTDAGYFPRAAQHERVRATGIDQAVMIACSNGAGWCRLPGLRATVKAGEVLVIPPQTAHSYGADQDHPWTIWWMHVAGRDVERLLGLARIDRTRPVVRPTYMHRITALADEVVTRMEEDDSPLTLLAASGAAWHTLSLLAADQTQLRHRASAVAQATAILRSRVGDRVSVPELARMVGLSTSHLTALFRRETGFGVLEYQTRQRMARGRELLDTTDWSVAAVARAVGYQDAFYFSRQFRQVHGVPPTAYRDASKG